MFPEASVTNIPLPFSDHCGLWTRMCPDFRSPKPFKFLAAWLNHPDFSNQIVNSWRNSETLIQNVERCSDNLKHWNQNVFGNIFNCKKRLLARLEGIERKLTLSPNPYLLKLRKGSLERI